MAIHKASGTIVITVKCNATFVDDERFDKKDQAYEALFDHAVQQLDVPMGMLDDMDIRDITFEEDAA